MNRDNTTSGDGKIPNKENREYAIHGAKVHCPFCTVPVGDLMVTSHNVMMQGKYTATIADCMPITNINFKGQCTIAPGLVPPPCSAVIRLGKWMNYAPTVKVSGNNALLTESVIPCFMGGSQIRIVDSGQVKMVFKKRKKPKVTLVEFLDENDTVLIPSSQSKPGGITCSDIMYGQKVKIRLTTENMEDGAEASFRLGVAAKSEQMWFEGLNDMNWNLTVSGNKCETELFRLPLSWYSDDREEYDYDNHLTKIDSDNLNSFYVRGWCGSESFELPEEPDRLKPYSYKRNYEELIGLFKDDDSGLKHMLRNYENKFVRSSGGIRRIVDEFIEFMCQDKDLTADDIKTEVEKQAKALWDAAVGKQDDRPLYWARNKMQVYLKRHPVFKDDLDLNKSIVAKDSSLGDIITRFEELSRNYTGIDFSKAGGKKKLLISGYDPFVLNPQKNGNILQANPSGCAALSLHGKTIGNYYIQTMIFPVRYKDFDDGYVEKYLSEYIKSFIPQRDIIITMSQGSPFRFDVDRFPCKNRGGFMDNMFRGDSSQGYNSRDFEQLPTGEEFYETTLPYMNIVPDKNDSKELFFIYLNQTYNPDNGGDRYKNIEGAILRAKLENIQKLKSVEGSGGDYLSNEIFYRVAKMRTEQNSILQTGHLHLPLIQSKSLYDSYQQFLVAISNLSTAEQTIHINKLKEEYHNIDKVTIDFNKDIIPLINKIKNLIEKI